VNLLSHIRSAPRDLVVAFQFLTRLPMPPIAFEENSLARSVKFFPIVGLAIGAGAALLHSVLLNHLGRPIVALAVLLYLVLITGCLHEDGLADTADGLGGGRNREQSLAILRDSRIGSYGATALIFSLLSRLILLASLPLEHFTAYVITAHVLCRWSTLPLSYYLPPARENDGQGARVAKLTSSSTLVFGSVLTLAIAAVALRQAAIAPVLSVLLITFLSGRFYLRKLGGITGDCFGATNQLAEIAVYTCGVWIR
jgi:adenosylcobinamide-GDP ribazoletransferase